MWGSVRARTAAASVLVVGVGVAAAGVAVASLLHRSLIADTDRATLHRAQDVAALVEAGTLPAQLPIPADKDNDELLVQVVDPSGRIVSASALMVDAPLTGGFEQVGFNTVHPRHPARSRGASFVR